MRALVGIAFLALLAGVVPTKEAQAFHEVASFSRTANTGGGANRYYSGSPRSKGYDCSICHVGAEERITIGLSSELVSGEYTPGLIYPITLQLVGEHRGLGSAFNPNTFTAEMIGPDGASVGRMAGGGNSGVELRDQGVVAIAEGFGNGESEWSFTWWAPEEGGAATLYVAMLDGDGADDPDNRFIDPLNDDVATLRVALCPVGELCAAPESEPAASSPAGCAIEGRGAPWAVLGCIALLLWRRRELVN